MSTISSSNQDVNVIRSNASIPSSINDTLKARQKRTMTMALQWKLLVNLLLLFCYFLFRTSFHMKRISTIVSSLFPFLSFMWFIDLSVFLWLSYNIVESLWIAFLPKLDYSQFSLNPAEKRLIKLPLNAAEQKSLEPAPKPPKPTHTPLKEVKHPLPDPSAKVEPPPQWTAQQEPDIFPTSPLSPLANRSPAYSQDKETPRPYMTSPFHPSTQTSSRQPLSPTPILPKYQSASPLPGSPTHIITEKENLFFGYHKVDAHKVLQKYHLNGNTLSLIENMRKWICSHILTPMIERIDNVDRHFTEKGLTYLTTYASSLHKEGQAMVSAALSSIPSPTSSTLSFPSQPFGTSQTQKPPSNLFDLVQNNFNDPMYRERILLEKYFPLSDVNGRKYFINRIRELQSSPFLSSYKWDGGSSSQEFPWISDYPTDAELLMHLCCVHLDVIIPGQASASQFSGKYYLKFDSKPDPCVPIQIKQVIRKPPHYNVIVGKSVYEIPPKQNNLFLCLLVFAAHIKSERAGYLELLNFGGKRVSLLSVLDSDD